VTHAGEVEAFEQPELLQEHGSLTPRPGLEGADPVIVDRERLFVRRAPVAQVLLCEQAAVALARGALDPESLPRRSLVWSPPARPVPALDVPYQLITRDNLGVLAGYWNEFAEDVGKERR
jgi:hypothetical protein